MGVTKYILKHPVTTVMALLCLVVFGISSVFSAKLEQMPDMETPMLIIMANYSGAGGYQRAGNRTDRGGDRHDGRRGHDFLHIERWTFDDHASVRLRHRYG